MSIDTGYTTHEIIPGLNLQARNDVDEAHVDTILRQCKAIAIGRDALIARIKEGVDKLVEIDTDDTDGLVMIAEMCGWNASRSDATADQHRRVILAVLDTLADEDLVLVLGQAEFSLNGGAS